MKSFRIACLGGALLLGSTFGASQHAAAVTVSEVDFPTVNSEEGLNGVVNPNVDPNRTETGSFSDNGQFLRETYVDTGFDSIAEIALELTVSRALIQPGQEAQFDAFLNGVQLVELAPIAFDDSTAFGSTQTFFLTAPAGSPILGDDLGGSGLGQDFVFEISVANAVSTQFGAIAFEIIQSGGLRLTGDPGGLTGEIPLPASVLLLGAALAGLAGFGRKRRTTTTA